MNHMSAVEEKPAIKLDIHGAFIRRTDLRNTNLERADLSGADAQNALFCRANFKNAKLAGTNLKGADLTGAKNLTVEQLGQAIVDKTTILPDYIKLSDIVNAGAFGKMFEEK